ncbi:MAG TPA: phenylacetate--CoA ligase [Kiritimatiellia bacterium]|nr:phenylacetate--CoA ligase [Kiritimatiellia bacterium]HRU70897.1 phenylacetate--CoA ligase [Kiritimatiellia bacterium]
MNRLRYWNERAETMSRDELAAVQLKGLQWTVKHVWANNEFYRRKLTEVGVEPGDIRELEDIRELPFLTKDDFRDQYPLNMLCMPRASIREMHMSSGSTGTPVVMAYTEADLVQWAECMARCQIMAGLQPGDVIQIMPTFGLFNGGFGFYHGARRAGLFTVPASSGNTARQIMLMRDFKVKAMGSVVSYSARIIEMLDEKGLELPDLKIGIFGAESFSDEMRNRVEARLGIKAFDIYGMTETGGVGTTGMDCEARCGIHVWEDQYLTEIVDPVTGAPLPDGAVGEVIFTSLTREAIPVIRYRTRDLTRIVSRERCACGRTSLRIDRIEGRCDDMLIVKGVNFFPKQVEQALMEIPGVLPEYQIILENDHGVTDVRINVEAQEGVTGYMVEKQLKERLGFSPKGDVFKPGTLPRTEGKAKRVFHVDKNA